MTLGSREVHFDDSKWFVKDKKQGMFLGIKKPNDFDVNQNFQTDSKIIEYVFFFSIYPLNIILDSYSQECLVIG